MSLEQRRKISIANKGRRHSEETKRKIGLKSKGRHPVCEFKKGNPAPLTAFKKGQVPWNKGTKGLIKGSRGWHHTSEAIEKNRLAHIGKKHSLESRQKLSQVHLARGSKHWAWRDGKSSRRVRPRNSLKYRLWREAVFRRDDWTCVICKARSGNGVTVQLEADHIKPWAYFPRLRYKVENGRTLCKVCHSKTPTYKGKAIKLYAKNRKGSR